MTAVRSFSRRRRRTIYRDFDGRDCLFKDPDTVIPITRDWSRYLDGDTIATSSWSVEEGSVTLAGAASTTTTASVKVSGDPADVAQIVNTITTAAGLTNQWSLRLRGREI